MNPGPADDRSAFRFWPVALLPPLLLALPFLRDYFFVDDLVWIHFAQGSFTEFFRNLAVSQHVRPLLYLYFKAAPALWGLAPLGYNLASLILHLGNTAGVFLAARALARDGRTAFFSALFFGLYFYGSEAVVWISAVSLLIATGLFLLAVLRLADGPRPGETSVLVGLTVLALLAHEAAAVLPLVWVGYLAIYRRGTGAARAQAPALAAAGLAIAAYAALHLRLYPAYQRLEFWPLAAAAWKSLVVMVLPVPILLARGNDLLARLHAPFAFGWGNCSLAFAVAAVAAGAAAVRAGWHRDRFLRFGAVWLFAALLPFVFKTAHLNAHFIDHRYAYLPAVGLSFLVGGVFARWTAGPRRVWAWGLLVGVLVFNAAARVEFAADKAVGKRVKAEVVAALRAELGRLAPGETATLYAPEWRTQEITAMVGLYVPAAREHVRVRPGAWSPADEPARPRGPILQFDLGINRFERLPDPRP